MTHFKQRFGKMESWDDKLHGDKRKCRLCEKEKSLTEFVVNETSRKGRGGYCKPCRERYQAEAYRQRKAKIQAMMLFAKAKGFKFHGGK